LTGQPQDRFRIVWLLVTKNLHPMTFSAANLRELFFSSNYSDPTSAATCRATFHRNHALPATLVPCTPVLRLIPSRGGSYFFIADDRELTRTLLIGPIYCEMFVNRSEKTK